MLNKTWLGIAVGGGAAVLYGKAGYILQFVNLDHANNTVSCTVGGVRVGAALHASCGVSFALMTGVGSPKDLEAVTGSGFDFAADLGGRFAEIAKLGGRAGSAVADGVASLNKIQTIADLKAFLGTERGKVFINSITGDFAPSNSTPSLFMFGTPVGAGIGAGIWYEWQEVYEVGAMSAWACVPLCWRLVNFNGSLWLQIKDIPAKDGSKITVFGKQFSWGIDGVIHFAEPKGIAQTSGATQRYSSHTAGIVMNNRLEEDPAFQKGRGASPPGGGINLSVRSLGAVQSVFGSLTSIPVDSTFDMGLGIRFEENLVWESYESAKLCTAGNGSISAITQNSGWKF